MRLTSEFWVSSLIRRVSNAGAFCVVVQKGAVEAGAIFLIIRGDEGGFDLLSPALQMSYGEDQTSERFFEERLSSVKEAEIEAQLTKEKNFDADIWIIEIEGCDITDFVELQKLPE